MYHHFVYGWEFAPYGFAQLWTIVVLLVNGAKGHRVGVDVQDELKSVLLPLFRYDLIGILIPEASRRY